MTSGSSDTLEWVVTNGVCVSRDTVIISVYPTNSPACGCGNIYSLSSANLDDKNIRVLNITNGTYSAPFGDTLKSVVFGFALDTLYKRFYYVNYNPAVDREIYYHDALGRTRGTGMFIPVVPSGESYNRAGYNPVDKKTYFISSFGFGLGILHPNSIGYRRNCYDTYTSNVLSKYCTSTEWYEWWWRYCI